MDKNFIHEELKQAAQKAKIEQQSQRASGGVNPLAAIEMALNAGKPIEGVEKIKKISEAAENKLVDPYSANIPTPRIGGLPPEMSYFEPVQTSRPSSYGSLHEAPERDIPDNRYFQPPTSPKYSTQPFSKEELREEIRKLLKEEFNNLLNENLAEKFAESKVISVLKKVYSKK
jgi:hypothetical protein